MERIKDDFYRRKDGAIDYEYYKALAAESRREERKRLVLATIKGGDALVRDAVAAVVRAVSAPRKLGGLRR